MEWAMANPQLPTLVEAKKWFNDTVIPLRTTSTHRLWKGPVSLVTGNDEDPNGLCGDTTLFVAEEYYRRFKDYRTSDGYLIGMILFEGTIFNHMANVMLQQSMAGKETYTYDQPSRQVKCSSHLAPTMHATKAKRCQYSTASLFMLQVFDLYYHKAQDVKSWWRDRSTFLEGRVTIGQQADFA